MSTPTVSVKTAAEAAVERFDEDQMPSDEDFLKNFRSKIQPRPSEQIADSLHFSGITLEESRRREKAQFLTEQKRLWRERRAAEKLARHQAEERQQLQRDIESGRYRRELSQLLDTCRTIASQREQIELMRNQAEQEEARIRAEVSDLSELKHSLAEQRDLLAALSVRVEQLARQQAAIVGRLGASYRHAKAEFVFYHGALVKNQPAQKLALDKAANYLGATYGGNYNWPFEAFDRRVEHFTSEQIVSASFQLEARFAALASLDPAAKP